jgi:glycosyltransferase involved in cell wall biosynthesis
MTKPILSIVIANYNYGQFLEDAIRSVIAQGVNDKIELIICDAASTDNSIDIIKKYVCGLPPNTSRSKWYSDSKLQARNARLISWWCSEKDGGQSAAFNKGFSHAKGEWLTWLNADELYADGALKAFLALVGRNSHAQWITGNYVNFNESDKAITHVTWGPHTSPSFLSNQHYPSAVFGSTSFWKKDVYLKVGPVDESLHYAMDMDYWARLVMAGYRQTRLNHYCWLFRDHDASKTVGVQTEVSKMRRLAEKVYHTNKNGYMYKFSISNPWYVFWLIWRFFDGSIFVRWYRKKSLVGQHISVLSEVMK